jgi:uncharacterized FlaG/YvyC family protein
MGTIQAVNAPIGPRAVGSAPANGHQDKATERSLPGSGATPAARDLPELDPQQAREYAQHVEEVLQRAVPEPHKITFRRDETTKSFVVEVRNPDGSLVRQYPSEEMLNLRRKLDELSGMVIDEMT